jgi:hypothetical protein
MSKPSQITGTYQLAEHERIQFTVTIHGHNYPDELAEAKATILHLMHDELKDVITQNHVLVTEGDE